MTGRSGAAATRSRRHIAAVAVIFAVALGLRLGLVAAIQGLGAPPDAEAQPDQLDYETLAFRLATGQGFTLATGAPTYSRPPGTSWALAPVYAVAGRSHLLARIWFCLLSALTCAAAAWLGGLAFGPAAGLVAGWWLVLYPGHFYYALHLVSEVPVGLWVTVGTGCTLRALRGRAASAGWSAGAAVAWALAILTRPQLLPLVPLAGATAGLALLRRQRRLATIVAAQVALTTVLVVPWVARNAVVMGRATLSSLGGYAFWGAHNDRVASDPALAGGWSPVSTLVDAEHPLRGPEAAMEVAAWRYGLDWVRHHLAELPRIELAKLRRLLTPFATTSNRWVLLAFALAWMVTAPLTVLGLVVACRDHRTAAAVLVLPMLATVTSALIFYGDVRFRDTVAPLLVVAAAGGAHSLLARWRSRSRPDGTRARSHPA